MNIIGLTKILKHKNFKALEGCPTPSICVEKCPDFEWSFNDGKVEGLRDFCYSMTDLEWNKQTIEDLVELRLCPAYLVPQRPLFDRCLPSFVAGNGFNVTNTTSVHDGKHSNFTFTFGSSSEDNDFGIASISGYIRYTFRF